MIKFYDSPCKHSIKIGVIEILVEIILLQVLCFAEKQFTNLILAPYTREYYIPPNLTREIL